MFQWTLLLPDIIWKLLIKRLPWVTKNIITLKQKGFSKSLLLLLILVWFDVCCIFKVPMFVGSLEFCRQTNRQTDRQTDRQTKRSSAPPTPARVNNRLLCFRHDKVSRDYWMLDTTKDTSIYLVFCVINCCKEGTTKNQSLADAVIFLKTFILMENNNKFKIIDSVVVTYLEFNNFKSFSVQLLHIIPRIW